MNSKYTKAQLCTTEELNEQKKIYKEAIISAVELDLYHTIIVLSEKLLEVEAELKLRK